MLQCIRSVYIAHDDISELPCKWDVSGMQDTYPIAAIARTILISDLQRESTSVCLICLVDSRTFSKLIAEE